MNRSAGLGTTVRQRYPELVLLLVTVVWGGTFFVTKLSLGDGGPFAILFIRFAVGAAALALLFRRRMRGFTRAELVGGSAIGIATLLAFSSQTIGLQYITSSKSAFLTAIYVPIVPLLQLVLLARAPRISAWIGILISFSGLLVLSWHGTTGLSLGLGEWLTLGGAVCSAFQIILVSRWAPVTDPMRLATVQLAVVAALAVFAIPLTGEALPRPSSLFVAGTLALGLLGTAFAIGAMNWAQQTVSATRATIIYSMEPVWAGIFGALAGEAITRNMLLGSGMIVAGILVGGIRFSRRRVGAIDGEGDGDAGAGMSLSRVSGDAGSPGYATVAD